MKTSEYHHVTTEQTLLELASDSDGLSCGQALQKLSVVGPNELIEQNRRRVWQIFWEQLTSTMVLILIAASVLSIIKGSYRDASAILAIVVLFAVLGFVQDYRAEKAMAALKQMAVPRVRALRSRKIEEISARELVPGDVILIEAGNIIPADCRLIDTANLKVQESALTGESEPISKDAAAVCPKEAPLAERSNMIYMGTIVSYGRARAVVTETGMKTELGKIASILQGVRQTATPLQRRLDTLGKTLAIIGILISVLIVIFGLVRGENLSQLILAGISVAVAVIPEGLPAVVTITLALGSQRMLRRKSLIRKLPAVETLGSVTVICSDKTGTLTQNKMTVTHLDTLHGVVDFHPGAMDSQAVFLLTAASLCNDARLTEGERFVGDPTEGALLVAASKSSVRLDELETRWPRIGEIPFDSQRKRMTTIHRVAGGGWPDGITPDLQTDAIALVKGAADGLREITSRALVNGRVIPMSDALRQQIHQSNERLAGEGIRVLGVAFRPVAATAPVRQETIETDLIFVGLIGMMDPPRMEVKESVRLCRAAGIRPVMITGDHPLTARAIACNLGIFNGGGRVMTGAELETLSADKFEATVDEVSVYARVSPEHKLKIISALQKKGQIVAMTGDGINDAPALKQADIGVAMGITGTDVSKEASDMVLLDDNFSTIVSAVEEGRIVFDNIRKFVKFSVAGNIGKVVVMLLGPLFCNGLPLLPLQLLWLNLLTDGLLGLSLGVEKAESSIMQRPPIRPKEGVFSNGGWTQVTIMGLAIGLISSGIGAWYYYQQDPKWQTMIFLTIGFGQVWQTLTVRSEKDTLWKMGLFSNPVVIWMSGAVILLQLSAVFVPVMSKFMQVLAIGWVDLGIAFFSGLIIFAVGEIRKILPRSSASSASDPAA